MVSEKHSAHMVTEGQSWEREGQWREVLMAYVRENGGLPGRSNRRKVARGKTYLEGRTDRMYKGPDVEGEEEEGTKNDSGIVAGAQMTSSALSGSWGENQGFYFGFRLEMSVGNPRGGVW